jgi:alpha-D-ribose 1-methylphosphonate 5-triphosphate synthase subunit PhnL
MSATRLVVNNLQKSFLLHTQHNAHISVFNGFSLSVDSGECAVLLGSSGMGKSTFLKCLYGNYKITSGSITLYFDDGQIDLAQCEPEWIHGLRRQTIGYVSQFLRVIPRVAAIDLVVEPLLVQGVAKETAYKKAAVLLERLHIPEKLWSLSPTTFSGGEQQRVNIARGFIANYPILLLDEPTASLDAKNRAVVVELIHEAKANGAAIVGIFHDEDVRNTVADKVIDLSQFVA